MAQPPTRVCVFNTVATPAAPAIPLQTGSNLIDIVTAVDGVLVPTPGPAAAGVPVVLNPSGLLDPSLLNSGTVATADVGGVSTGNLVTLYVPTAGPYLGLLTMQPATASATGVGEVAPAPPDGYPAPALGFVTALSNPGQKGTVNFMGTFTYNDPLSEFNAGSIGKQVYLADSGDGLHSPGSITLTPPSSVGSLKQSVGLVTSYNSGIVTVNFVPSFPAAAGSGTVTFVGVTVPSWLSVTPASTTSSATFNIAVNGATTGYVLTATSPTTAAWQASSGGAPGTPPNSIQFNNAGVFGGSANYEWSGTTVKIVGATSTSGPDLEDFYTFGASGANIGIAVQQYGDARGLGHTYTDAAGDTVSVFPYGVQGNNAAYTSSFSIQPGFTAEFSGMGVSISGDAFGNDILDLATHGVGSPAFKVDQYGQVSQGSGTALTINYSANHDPTFLYTNVVANNDVGASASLIAYGHLVNLSYKGHAGSPSFSAVYGLAVTANTDPTTTDNIAALYGSTIFAYPQGTGSVNEIIGSLVQAGQSTNGACSLVEPLQVRSSFSTSTAAVGAVNFAHIYGLGGTSGGLTGSPTINGILIDDQGEPPIPTGSVTHALYINPQSGAGNYAIYVAGGVSSFTGVATAIVTKTTTYTVGQNDHTINCNGTFTVTLPTTGIKVGQEFYIKNIGTGVITVSSSVNIDGATSLTLSSQYASITVQWDGTQWWIY